jgi:hypothetical protein
MYRSWSGDKVFCLQIQAGVFDAANMHMQPAYITSITWETSRKGFHLKCEQDAKELVLKVCEWVLNVTITDKEMVSVEQQ